MGKDLFKIKIPYIRCYIKTNGKSTLQIILSVVAMGGQIINAGGFWTKITKDFFNPQA